MVTSVLFSKNHLSRQKKVNKQWTLTPQKWRFKCLPFSITHFCLIKGFPSTLTQFSRRNDDVFSLVSKYFRKIHYSTREPHVKWENLTWNSRVRLRIFLESHSLFFSMKQITFWLRLLECYNTQRGLKKRHSSGIKCQDCQKPANRNPARIRKVCLDFVVGKSSFKSLTYA